MNVLFVEPPPVRRVGGIETALAGWSAALRTAGIDAVRRDAPSDSDLRAADVIHFHGLWEPDHPRLRRRTSQLGKPWLASPHGMLEPWALRHKRWKKLPWFHLVERPSLRRARRLVATCEAEAAVLAQWFPASQIVWLPLGIQESTTPDAARARAELGWSPAERVVVFLSRLHEKKGLHLLIEAWAQLQPAPDARLVIVGEGDPAYVDPLRARTRARPDLRIDWLGARWGDARWAPLQGADLFCLPSFSENFGLVVAESLLVGTPVLTTPFTPWESLRGDLPVSLCEPTVPALVAALRHALAEPPPSADQRLRTHATTRARFGWSALAPRYAALYASILGDLRVSAPLR